MPVHLGKRMHALKNRANLEPTTGLNLSHIQVLLCNRNCGEVKNDMISSQLLLRRRKEGGTSWSRAQKILRSRHVWLTFAGRRGKLQINSAASTVVPAANLTLRLCNQFIVLQHQYDHIHLGQEKASERGDEEQNTGHLLDPNLTTSMQLVPLKTCGFFFPSKPHGIC